ncbi:MAG: aminotransferase class I/II-fold pyridoxal phosphate-dependent enzyme, partial [Gammaproteobacteria bacterium]
MMRDLKPELDALRAESRFRQRRVVSSPQGPEIEVDGRRLLSFCSNDYLGLANHPEIAVAFKRGINRWGTGSGAAHLITGHSGAHHALEEELADWLGRERALLFSTGYMANLGAVTALAGRGDSIIEDRLNHASLLDAGLLSGARMSRFHHTDMEHLAKRLSEREGGEKLVVTDGVFSMDGDVAPLGAMADLAKQHDAWLMVDDAHGFGPMGREGRGCVDEAGLTADAVPILVGTLGKAFGSSGAFVAGSSDLIDTLINKARPYIYTTAQPPAVAEATRAALKLVREEQWRRDHLNELIQQLRRGCQSLGLELMPSTSAIQPLVV